MTDNSELKEIIKDSELINDYELSKRIRGVNLKNAIREGFGSKKQVYNHVF